MIDLATVLQTAKVRQAVIVDDAYDNVPVAKDLSQDAAKWAQFFEDLNADDEKQLVALFPRYEELRADQLQAENEFIALLWNERAKLRKAVIDPLFERYAADKAQDLGYLKVLTDCLAQCAIGYDTAGRTFEDKAVAADLVIIDLFLGSAQDDEAIRIAIAGLKKVIERRPANPPLVILMSRSGRLEDKRKEFRDSVGLFESGFRIIRKAELAEDGKLPRLLVRLARHYPDSLKLAAFLNAWQGGLGRACNRTANLIRTLDLADYAQIQQLLLAEEGEPSGSYLVDVFDRVLQHEIERETAIIDAAIGLNGLDTSAYPPPYVAGSKDLQALVYRSLFQNNGRLRLAKPTGSAVSFGDILRRKPAPAAAPVAPPAVPGAAPATPAELLGDIGPADVLIVMTPACDLQHMLTKRCLLLKGTLVSLQPDNWSYKDQPIRTPVYEVAPEERYLIKWDLKHFETVAHAELKALLTAPTGFQVVARLREAHTLELQQKLLSNLGRVGLIAPMPATFPVKVEAYLPDPGRKLVKLSLPALADNPGVVFTGRKGNGSATTLVLCEDACEALCKAIQTIDLATVNPLTRPIVTELRVTDDFLLFERGVDISDVSDRGFKEISVTRPPTSAKAAETRVIALLRRGGVWIDELLNDRFAGKAGIILVLSE